METKEISQAAWTKFCDRLNESCRGSMITIQLVRPDGSTSMLAESAPLQSIILDQESDACNNTMVIQAALSDENEIRHFIIEPIYLRLRNGENDRYNHLHILAESGTTILSFHPGLNPELLENLDVS